MNCCSDNGLTSIDDEFDVDSVGVPEAVNDPGQICRGCGRAGRIVPRKTIFLMLNPESFDLVAKTQYRFCADPDCPVIYFAEDGDSNFTANDLRIRVGLKEKQEPIPVCYCFGFDQGDLRKELEECGQTTIPGRIAALIRQGFCACQERNPSGGCCIGEVNMVVERVIKRLAAVELKQQ